MILNIVLILAVALVFVAIVYKSIQKKQNAEVEQQVNVDDQTYTLQKMTEYIKKRLDEITKVNLYDLGLTEEELKRRKNKKYELKKALKGCTYGDVNDKKYVKELMYDILAKEYGVDESYFLETLDEMVEQAFDDQCTGANPRYPLMSEIKELYLRAYYGK